MSQTQYMKISMYRYNFKMFDFEFLIYQQIMFILLY